MSGINWSEFAEANGMIGNDGDPRGLGGDGSAAEIAALNKALSVGAGSAGVTAGTPVTGGLGPLMPQSLEGVLTSLTYSNEDFPFWKALPKDPAFNTAEEYNQLVSVGQGEAGFIAEGDLPEEEDSKYVRQVTLVKFMGTTRRVTHVGSIVRTRGVDSAIAAETEAGTLWLMRQLEESLFFGNSAVIPVQFDGLEKQIIDNGLVYDLRGGVLTEEILNGLTEVVRSAPNYGKVDTLYMSTGVKSDFVNKLRDRLRFEAGSKVVDPGFAINSFTSANGKLDLVDDVFITARQKPYTNGLGASTKRPLTPSVGAAGLTSPVDATGLFAAGDAGNYYYKVVAVNRYGRSAPVTTAVVAVAAGDNITIPIVDNGQGTTGYIVYRSSKNAADASDAKEIFRVARTGPTQNIIDLNAYLPGCSSVFGVESKPTNLQWKQLAPFTRLPLATIDTSIRWMQVLYGALQVKAPRHNFVIKNVGRDPNAAQIAPAFVGFEN